MLLSIKLKPVKFTSNSRAEIFKNIVTSNLSSSSHEAPMDYQGNYIIGNILTIKMVM